MIDYEVGHKVRDKGVISHWTHKYRLKGITGIYSTGECSVVDDVIPYSVF
jgi:hypothetical protein